MRSSRRHGITFNVGAESKSITVAAPPFLGSVYCAYDYSFSVTLCIILYILGSRQVAEDEIEAVDDLPRLESIPTASEADVKVTLSSTPTEIICISR